MIRNSDFFKQSSFLSLEKDTKLIVEKILSNKKLQKLLFYNTKDCLAQPDLTPAQFATLVKKQIFNTPDVPFSPEVKSYLLINFDTFVPNPTNEMYRDSSLDIDIVCAHDVWALGDYQLRPYKIAGEIDKLLNKQHLTGIGVLNFVSGMRVPVNSDLAAFSLSYNAIHGSDDMVE